MRSFFSLDYPVFELIFSVADSRDKAIPVVQRLIAEYPQVKSRLIVGSVEIGPNPKVNNMVLSYEQAEHDVLLVSDSNVRVEPGYLRGVVAHLAPDVGVVTAVVAGRYPEGIGGRLEATYLNSFYARWMQVSRAMGHSFVVGKSMLFRRSVAERFGGIRNLGQYIAEDYMAGQAMRKLGLRVEIMRDPIPQYIGAHSFSDFWQRHLRWGRIRKAQAYPAFLIEPCFGSIASGCIGAWGFHGWLGMSFFSFLALHLFVWMISDLMLMRALGGKLGWRSLFDWGLRELLTLPLWIHIASGSSVHWRGTRMRILPGGLVTV